MILRLILISVGVLNVVLHINADGLIEVFKWKQIDFYNRGHNAVTTLSHSNNPTSGTKRNPGIIYFPGQYHGVRSTRQISQNNENASYIPYNNVPMGVTHYKGRLFVTMPRRRVGIPSTLNYIDLHKDGTQQSPKLNAYPDFETNQFMSNSENLVSVYRTTVDGSGRLWFIDTGMLEYPGNFRQIQRPSLWIIDLRTDNVVRRYEVPTSVVEEGRGFASITVDTGKEYNGDFAYIPDLVNNRLYVYSFAANRMWTFQHNYFNFDPIAGDFNIGGQSFSWDDGIFSVTLGTKNKNGTRNIFFHAMASNNEFTVLNEVLQNEALAQRGDYSRDFQLLGSRGNQRQSTMHKYDPRTDVVFYAEIQKNGVGCWNTRKQFSAANHGTVAQNEKTMIYPSDLTIDDDGTLWLMTNSMPIFIYSTLDPNTFNFRIWKQNTAVAAQNTVCAY